MHGREPIGQRLQERGQLFVVLSIAIFVGLLIIFAADFVHDWGQPGRLVLVRVATYLGIALVAAGIAVVLMSLRSYRWSLEDGRLHLHGWGELSGVRDVVGLRVRPWKGQRVQLEAVLAVGDVVILKRGRSEVLERDREGLAAALRVQ